MKNFCAATMCPLFAADGSPWTGHVNAPCEGTACAWFQGGSCEGGRASVEQVHEAARERGVLQLGTTRMRRMKVTLPKTYDCPRAHECQWQQEASGLCPPRLALSLGVDPRACAY